jgi:hypothetical protein
MSSRPGIWRDFCGLDAEISQEKHPYLTCFALNWTGGVTIACCAATN